MARPIARVRLGRYCLGLVLTLAAAAPAQAHKTHASPLCSPVLPPFMHCDAYVARRSHRLAHGASTIGYGPADLQGAYGLANLNAANAGAGQTVAVVDAYDNPYAESDLAGYRSNYGLPACTTANGCFKKVNQLGGTAYPAADPGWAGEISLDLDMVSAVCPHCKILLVEATSSSSSDLGYAINMAAALGAGYISNSYGGIEGPGETAFDYGYLRHPGRTITFSSGDDGYGVQYPAASPYVTAVGGTSLSPAANPRGWSETAWAGAGSGCSAYEDKPAWQHDTDCASRTVADISAVADPSTPVSVYDTYQGGWTAAGGTSASAPIVAAAYALLGPVQTVGSFPYENSAWVNDVDSGSNGTCSILYLCNGVTGFDGPTGTGTPNFDHPSETPVAGTGLSDGESTNGAPPGTSYTPPPTQPQPAPVVRSSVAVLKGSLSVTRTGKFKLRLTCGHGPACGGVLTLQALAGRGVLRPVGKQRFSIQPGKSITLTVRLSKSGMRLLKQKKRLRVYGTALDSDGTTAQASFVLHPPKRRR